MAWRRSSARCAAAVLLVLTASAAAVGAVSTPKTLMRVHDPVIVSTAALSALADRRTTNLRLYRTEAGRLVAMPFQFDARDRQDGIVVDGPADFEFDDDDELVFMAKDTGDRVGPDVLPPDCDAAVEIEVVDRAHDARGWAYLLHFRAEAPPAVTQPYVTFDRTTNQARSVLYQVDYAPARNFFTGMRVDGAGGGSGVNLLRQTRMIGAPRFFLLLAEVTLRFTEQNSIVEIEGVRSGPVRVVRKVRLSVDLGSLAPDLPNGTAYTYHYLSSFVTPTSIGFSWLLLKALRDFRFEGVLDFQPEVLPLRYWDGANPDGLTLADHAEGRAETAVDHDWWVHSSEAGTMLHAFVIPERWRQWGIVRGTVVHDGDGEHAAGYSLLHMRNLRDAGTYDLLQASIVLPGPYHPGDESEPMEMLRAPLETRVRVLTTR